MFLLTIIIGLVGDPEPLVMRIPVQSQEACVAVAKALTGNLAARSGKMEIVCQAVAPAAAKPAGIDI